MAEKISLAMIDHIMMTLIDWTFGIALVGNRMSQQA